MSDRNYLATVHHHGHVTRAEIDAAQSAHQYWPLLLRMAMELRDGLTNGPQHITHSQPAQEQSIPVRFTNPLHVCLVSEEHKAAEPTGVKSNLVVTVVKPQEQTVEPPMERMVDKIVSGVNDVLAKVFQELRSGARAQGGGQPRPGQIGVAVDPCGGPNYVPPQGPPPSQPGGGLPPSAPPPNSSSGGGSISSPPQSPLPAGPPPNGPVYVYVPVPSPPPASPLPSGPVSAGPGDPPPTSAHPLREERIIEKVTEGILKIMERYPALPIRPPGNSQPFGPTQSPQADGVPNAQAAGVRGGGAARQAETGRKSKSDGKNESTTLTT